MVEMTEDATVATAEPQKILESWLWLAAAMALMDGNKPKDEKGKKGAGHGGDYDMY